MKARGLDTRRNASAHRGIERLEQRRLLSGFQPLDAEAFGGALPRYATPAEKEAAAAGPQTDGGTRVPSTPPTGPIKPVAEFEQMEGLVLSWRNDFPTGWKNIIGQIAKRVTVEGQGRIYLGVPNSANQSGAVSTLQFWGADLNRVTFYTVPLDSIWARDYGPRYVYEGDVRVITDHVYNVPRPLDNDSPIVFGQFKQNKYYDMGRGGTSLVHGGGNYHLNGLGDAYATTLVNSNNPGFSTGQIQAIWSDYQGNTTTIPQQFPLNIDGTGHIDMWMQIYDTNKVFIADWPQNVGSAQDVICDNTAALMASRGYQVTRLPSYSLDVGDPFGPTHFTYTNMVMFNNIVLLPRYNTGPGGTVSTDVFNTVSAAFAPLGKTVYQITGDSIVTAAGVFHCIVQHLPVHRGLAGVNGGLAPTAYLEGPDTGATFTAGQQVTLRWITDDDAPVAANGGVTGVDVQLSTDGGATWTTTIAANQPALGSVVWTVPAGVNTALARLRVVARDGVNNTGVDLNNGNFTIGVPGSQEPGQPLLAESSDTGLSSSDRLTRLNNATTATRLTFDVPGTVAGATVEVFADGVLIGSVVATGATTTVVTDGSTALADGTRAITARQTQPGLPASSPSLLLNITVDTAAPALAPGGFFFETEQRATFVLASEVAFLGSATLTNLTTGQTLSGNQVIIEDNNATISVRAAAGILADGNWRAAAPAGELVDAAGNPSTVAFASDFFVFAGDADRNRSVNIDDFGILAARFNQPGSFSQGDFNYSGTADIDDFGILAAKFNTSLPPVGGRAAPGAAPANLASSFGTTRIADEIDLPTGGAV